MAKKKAVKKKATKKRFATSVPPTRRIPVRVLVGRLGGEPKTVDVQSGTKLSDLVKAQGLEHLQVRVNGQDVPSSTELRPGDVVVAVPEAIIGEALPIGAYESTVAYKKTALPRTPGRYAHLDLESYRKSMSPRDYNFFINFIGADALGLTQDS